MRESRTRVGQFADPFLFYAILAGVAKHAEDLKQISAARRRARAWGLIEGTLKPGFPEAL